MSLSPLNGKFYYKIGPLKVRRTNVTLMERTTYFEVLLCYNRTGYQRILRYHEL
jgi:hypothetical protein